MQLNQLTDRIYCTPSDRDTDRPVLGYIQGDRFSVMIDAGNSASHVEDYLSALTAAGLPEPDLCVITHWHWDHTFGIHRLDCPVLSHPDTVRELRRMQRWQWDTDSMRQRLETGEDIEFAHRAILAEYADPASIRIALPDAELDGELTLRCGGVTCRCLHLPSAHSDDSLVILLPEERVLFIGDIYGDDFYNGHFRDRDKTLALCTALEALDFSTAVPGHGGPSPKGGTAGLSPKLSGPGKKTDF